jgi:hypothetical protein
MNSLSIPRYVKGHRYGGLSLGWAEAEAPSAKAPAYPVAAARSR